jgi:hypothetical protein
MHRIELLSIALASVILVAPPAQGQATQSKAELEAHLTLLSEELHEGEDFKVRAEIQNISDHPVLVWRDLSSVSSLPFQMEIQLEDVAGQQHSVSTVKTADYLVLADLQAENGILKWRIPLYPHTFIGTYFILNLGSLPPGQYRLHGRYIVGRPPHEVSSFERKLLASKISIFQGTVETNSIQLKVLRKEAKTSRTIFHAVGVAR